MLNKVIKRGKKLLNLWFNILVFYCSMWSVLCIDDDELGFIRNPFILPVEKVSDSLQHEFLELKADSCARDLFNEESITEFWPLMCDSYPKVTKKADY